MSEPSTGETPTPPKETIVANVPTPEAVTAKPPTVVAATPPKPAAAPPKPTAKPAPVPTRRFFLLSWFGSWFSAAWIAFSASMVGMLLGTVRFLFPNVLAEPPSSFRAGFIRSYEENKVSDEFKDQGAWVIRAKDEKNRDIIYALSTTCTHLGCTPNWLEGEKKFKCPCHGSGFKITGINFEGPAPRPLERYGIEVVGGEILVDKSKKYQKELGQWNDESSFITL